MDAGLAVRSLPSTLAHIFRSEGLKGLWKGSVPSVIKVRRAVHLGAGWCWWV